MKKISSIFLLLILSGIVNAQNNVCFTVAANPHSSTPGLSVFTKFIDVFGVKIFATPAVSDEKIKHCAAVMAEYLDNNEDGTIDNTLVTNAMVSANATMVMFGTDGSAAQNTFFNNYNGNWELQDLYATETLPAGSSQSGGFDATLEEVLHLITHVGYANSYPTIWGEATGTSIAIAMDTARGGHFTTIPTPYPSGAWYKYDDQTCDYSCMITEYVYWSLTTWLNAQSYTGRCNDISNEWTLCTPAQQQTDILMHALITNSTYKLATSLPDGNYCPPTLGINKNVLSGSTLNIYPNPSNDKITVWQKSSNSISVFNYTGSLIQFIQNPKEEITLDLNSLQAGLYFIKTGNGQVKRFILND
tara:strand:- start:1073 stop:2152 length:1080 start_codon:yes stop_codon:yes gene_type:complete